MKVFLLALSLPFVWWGVPNAFAQSESLSRITGRLEIIQVDNFDNPIEEKIYLLEDSVSHQTFELYFAGEPPANLSTGSTISVQGWVEGSAIYLEAVSFSSVPLSKDASGIEVLDVQVAPEATSSNVRRAVVLIADFIDSPSDCTSESQAADAMFTGVQSVDGMYRESSFGVVSFPGDTNANGQPDVYRVSIPASVADACAPTPWATQADAAAVSMGVDLSLYQHKVYALPQNVTCSWAGLANVGCAGTCRAWTRICYSDIFAHELGHNLGMAHASTDVNNDGIVDSEYGDTSDIMGYGGIGWRQFNGPHKEQMGWLPPSQITEITGGGTRIVTLSPLEIDAASAPYSQLVKIPKAGTNEYYYVSYRRRIGYDAALSLSYADRANVHHSHPPDSRTFFIQALSDTGTFQDLISGITVTQLSHDANGVTVQIDAVVINDTTPPTVSMTSPANGATVTGAINVSATASDNVGVVGVQFTRNGVYIGAEDTTPPYSISWNTLSEADGSHSLSAVARDAAGNTTTASPVVVTVSNNTDTSPPVISNVGAGGVTQTAATIT
ncbi:MAG TPA: Ig-like domain-containing protein, partial [Bdellovibrionota bacterium]|nr:Ig-like domain-containing protein [Bdellovibrionota bacterium]